MHKVVSLPLLGIILAFSVIASSQQLTYVIPADGTILATIPGAGTGVGVAFDGTNLYWLDSMGDFLHKRTTTGLAIADIDIVGANPTVISWDPTRQVFWGAKSTDIYQITRTGIATFQFSVLDNRPGDCDTGFGCFGLVDGINYDGTDDSIWYSPTGSQRIYHYDTDGILLGFFDINDSPNDASECGTIYGSGIAIGNDVVYLGGPAGCNLIFKYDKTGNKLGSFTIGAARAADMECDSITFESQGVDAIWTKLVSSNQMFAFAVQRGTCISGGGAEVEICGDRIDNDGDGLVDEDCVEICGDHIDNDGDLLIDEGCEICGDGKDNDGDGLVDEDCEPGPIPTSSSSIGKITAGGAQISKGTNFGFNVQSDDGISFKAHLQYHDKDININLNNIEINFMTISPDKTSGSFTGTATDNGVPVTFQVLIQDKGEPGKNDTFSIKIPLRNYEKSGTLTKGNIQIH